MVFIFFSVIFIKLRNVFFVVGGAQFTISLIIAEAVYPGGIGAISANFISDLGVWQAVAANFQPFNHDFRVNRAGERILHQQTLQQPPNHRFSCVGRCRRVGRRRFPRKHLCCAWHPSYSLYFGVLAFVVGGISAISFSIRSRSRLSVPYSYPWCIHVVGGDSVYATRHIGYLGIGVGGMERMMAYPTLMAVLIIAFGGYLLGKRD